MNVFQKSSSVSIIWIFVLGLSALEVSILQTASATDADPRAVKSRLENVERLIEVSSGARQVDAIGIARAVEIREQARDLHRRAADSFRAGDIDGSNVLLEKATRAMFDAIRLSGTPTSVTEKNHEDFESRAKSIDALVEALDRIGAEKGAQDKVADVRGNIGRLVAEARSLESSGKSAEGRKILDVAYDLAKRTIDELREGDTLVRSLKFESKEEEFRYEIDRNDTHQMLVTVLLEDKRKSKGVDKMVTKFVERALALRAEAEKLARSGDHEAAVKSLEDSTRELTRAIRSAGVYIPG